MKSQTDQGILKDLLLITPPFTQLNTPYPATAYLKGFLNTKSISSFQMDLGIEVILELFSKSTLDMMFQTAFENDSMVTENSERIYALKDYYLDCLEDVISFLQGNNPTFARLLSTENFLPQASRFDQIEDLNWAFGNMGMQDKAKHLATLFLEDLSDFIVECIDPNFGFSRYAEKLGQSANSFNELHEALQEEESLIDSITLNLLKSKVEEYNPKLICLSVPFPGNLFSAFRCAQFIKKHYPEITISMGGGFPNTELRSLKDIRVFDYFDFITLDDGEKPVELLLDFLNQDSIKIDDFQFKRTFYKSNNVVVYNNSSTEPDYKQKDVGTPDYGDLPLKKYISVIEITNPMHSLWSDGRWNKLTMAHGCYWGKCTFCDISLDYIKVYEPVAAKLLVDRMEELITQTGETGFHFVDEAAPPALMRSLALEILKRNLIVTWWTNIRFEKSFTQDLCDLLARSGCIAISGGLEVASDRLLKLIDKGVSVAQVAQVTKHLTQSNIMVHAYLMYGYPTQTKEETIDSLEMVRQLFENEILQSGFWHQFALTAHSPIGIDPESYNIKPLIKEIQFANNDVQFEDKTGIDHAKFGPGLKTSLFNYMNGVGFDMDLQEWFDFKIPKPKIDSNYIANCLIEEDNYSTKSNAKLVWLGNMPFVESFSKKKKGKQVDFLLMTFHSKTNEFSVQIEKETGLWLIDQLDQISPSNTPKMYSKFRKEYELKFEEFELFWFSKAISTLRKNGLLVL